nr:hypothetical transcript [Hymenolepis microstoma]
MNCELIWLGQSGRSIVAAALHGIKYYLWIVRPAEPILESTPGVNAMSGENWKWLRVACESILFRRWWRQRREFRSLALYPSLSLGCRQWANVCTHYQIEFVCAAVGNTAIRVSELPTYDGAVIQTMNNVRNTHCSTKNSVLHFCGGSKHELGSNSRTFGTEQFIHYKHRDENYDRDTTEPL